jgi:hypothetical protein
MAGAIERSGGRTAAITGGLVVVVGVVTGIVATAGREPVDPLLGTVALGAVVAGPGLVALLGLRRRAALWLPAGIAAMPLAFLSFAGVTLPLFPAGIVLVATWARRPEQPTAKPAKAIVTTATVVFLLLVAAAALFISEDPASWTTPTESGATSDIVTNREAMLSLTSLAMALGAGWALTRPPR